MRFEITALLAATGALAAPVSFDSRVETSIELVTRDGGIADNTSKCSGYNNAFWNIDQSAFSVTIGRPYLDGSRCDLVEDKISQVFTVDGFKCQGASDKKNTVIKIKSNMKSGNLANINKALKNAYPEIEFSCPTALRN